jgi:hypothetical protein
MSRGDDRRTNDLENFEAEFLEALAQAKELGGSAYIAEKMGKRRGGATPLDVDLFTLESKIVRLREKLGLPPFVVPLKAEAKTRSADGWPSPPAFEHTLYALDLSQLHLDLLQSGREPEELFAKARYAGAKSRQGADQPSWRLAMVEVGQDHMPGKLALTIYPLPEHADAELAAQKLADALERLISWSETAKNTPPRERPRLLHVTYARTARELAFHAR